MSTLLEVGALLTWASNALACSLVLGTKGRNAPLGLLVVALFPVAGIIYALGASDLTKQS